MNRAEGRGCWGMRPCAAAVSVKEAAGGKAAGKGAPRRKKSQLQRLAEQAEQEKRDEAARQEEVGCRCGTCATIYAR